MAASGPLDGWTLASVYFGEIRQGDLVCAASLGFNPERFAPVGRFCARGRL